MKIMLVIAILVCFTQVSAFRQPLPRLIATECYFSPNVCTFSSFRGHRQGRGITIMWGMSSNTGINVFDIECTYEDPADPYSVWMSRGSVPNNNKRTFKFTDASVLPGTMYYRVHARMNNGSTVTSEICTLRIVGH